MYCPNCGNQAAEDQKFCRSCGMNLQKVTPVLIEHLAESGGVQPEIDVVKNIRRLAVRGVIWGATLMFAGIALAIVGKMIDQDQTVSGAGALTSITGMFLIVYFLLSAVYKLSLTERRMPREAKLSEAKTTAQLAPERLSALAPSIAERTTDLLANAAIQSTEGRRSDELRV
jgi:zinc-ribbon domain